MTDRSWETVHPLRNDPRAPFFSWDAYGVHVEPELILRQDPEQAFPLKLHKADNYQGRPRPRR